MICDIILALAILGQCPGGQCSAPRIERSVVVKRTVEKTQAVVSRTSQKTKTVHRVRLFPRLFRGQR
jgi:hypothetical protein